MTVMMKMVMMLLLGDDDAICLILLQQQENRVVLETSAVAYISLHSPVRLGRSSCSTASPSLFQLAADVHKVPNPYMCIN